MDEQIPEKDRILKNINGKVNLTLIGVTGILGSGWLYSPYLAEKNFGSSGAISWIVGIILALSLGTSYAKLAIIMPSRGLMVHISKITSSDVVSNIWSIVLFLSYSAMPAVELFAFLFYFGRSSSISLVGPDGSISTIGFLVGLLIVGVFAFVLTKKVRFIFLLNNILSPGKIFVPVILSLSVAFLFYSNIPFSLKHISIFGIFAPLTQAGIIFSCLGFRQIIELSGDVKDVEDIPMALLSSVVISGFIYLLVQFAFAVYAEHVGGRTGNGFLSLESAPVLLLAEGLPLSLVYIFVLIETFMSPLTTSFVAMATESRLFYALGVRYKYLSFLTAGNKSAQPIIAIYLAAIIAVIFLMPFPSWIAIVKMISALSIVSYSLGPLVLLHLRKIFPEEYNMRVVTLGSANAAFGFILGCVAYGFAGLTSHIIVCIIVVIAVLAFGYQNSVKHTLRSVREALWVIMYSFGTLIISFLSSSVIKYGFLIQVLLSIVLAIGCLVASFSGCPTRQVVLGYKAKILSHRVELVESEWKSST